MSRSGPIRVLHLNTPTTLAGAERVILNYFEYHDTASVTPRLLSFVNRSCPDNHFTREAERSIDPFSKVLMRGFSDIPRQVREIVQAIRGHGIELIHSHGYRSDVLGFLAARRTGIPVISTVHGWTPINRALRMYECLDRLFLGRFDRVICVSRPLYEGLSAVVPHGRLFFVPNAVALSDADGTAPGTGERDNRTVLYVGRLSPEKGLDLLLHACALMEEPSDMRLLIVGDGPCREEYERLAQELGITDRTFFLGHQSDVDSLYRGAGMLVLPSRTEGLPMTLLEAMSFGVPVIGTRVGGIPDLIRDGESGILVEPEDLIALKEAMLSMLAKPMEARALGVQGRSMVRQEYAAGPWARRIENVYFDTVKSKRSCGN